MYREPRIAARLAECTNRSYRQCLEAVSRLPSHRQSKIAALVDKSFPKLREWRRATLLAKIHTNPEDVSQVISKLGVASYCPEEFSEQVVECYSLDYLVLCAIRAGLKNSCIKELAEELLRLYLAREYVWPFLAHYAPNIIDWDSEGSTVPRLLPQLPHVGYTTEFVEDCHCWAENTVAVERVESLFGTTLPDRTLVIETMTPTLREQCKSLSTREEFCALEQESGYTTLAAQVVRAKGGSVSSPEKITEQLRSV